MVVLNLEWWWRGACRNPYKWRCLAVLVLWVTVDNQLWAISRHGNCQPVSGARSIAKRRAFSQFLKRHFSRLPSVQSCHLHLVCPCPYHYRCHEILCSNLHIQQPSDLGLFVGLPVQKVAAIVVCVFPENPVAYPSNPAENATKINNSFRIIMDGILRNQHKRMARTRLHPPHVISTKRINLIVDKTFHTTIIDTIQTYVGKLKHL